MTGRRLDIVGVGLTIAGAVVGLSRESLARALAHVVHGIGIPALELLLTAAAVVLLAGGAFRLRQLLALAGSSALGGIDALEARFEKLPRRRGLALRALTLALVVGLTVVTVVETTYFGSYLETRAVDLFFRLRFPEHSQVELATGAQATSAARQDDVVVLALDDETLNHVGWPMPRIHYARLIDAVSQAKPRSLAFDVSLVDPSRDHPEWDAALGEAAQRAGNLTFTFTVARVINGERPAFSPEATRALAENTIPWHASAAALPDYSEIVGGEVAPQPLIAPVAAAAHAVAMANVLLDGGDDLLRHSMVAARLGERLLPSLSLRLAADALGVPLSEVRLYPGSHLDLGGKLRVPIDSLGRTLTRYQGRHDPHGLGPFRYVSIWSLIRSDLAVTLAGNPLGADQRFVLDDRTRVTRHGAVVAIGELPSGLLGPGARVSGRALYAGDPGRILTLEVSPPGAPQAEPEFELVDERELTFTTTLETVKESRLDASFLAGKHVLVGSTALAAADLRNSPLGEMPGVEHHATMLANLLHGDVFTPSPALANAAAVVGVALAAAAVGVLAPTEVGLLLTGLLMLMSLTASFLLFRSGIYVPVVGPSVAAGGTYFLSLLLGARASRNARDRAEHEREFVRQTFGRYLTEQVVQQLLDSPDGLRLGGQRDFVTIMMTDLRGFTSMCGSMEPEAVVKLLNHYLEAMTRIITRYGGTIDEFIGDAILVVFGAPLPLERAEARAVACAIEMLNAMPGINVWNVQQRLPTVEMGIGVHSGEVVLGNIGSELRAKYGIVGSTINLTSRVESYTVGGQVLISEATRERCGDLVTVGAAQVVSPKGVKGTLTIYEALAVSAPFEVRLESAREELAPPRVPLQLRYATVKNKQVSPTTQLAQVEAISEQGLELRVSEALPVLSDLQLRVIDGGEPRPGELYGKVLKAEVRPGVVYLRLTSVPAELKPVLEAARGGVTAPSAPVAESAMVSG